MGKHNGSETALWLHTGAVLAGGKSRRMGRPKHALRLPDGRQMIEAVADALADVCSTVVVVGGAVAEALPDVEHIADLREGQGPLGGLEALLASRRDTEYLVCPCDLPLVSAGVLLRLTAAADAMATVFRIEGEAAFEPLPARISGDALDLVRTGLDQGNRAVHRLMEALEPEVVLLSKAEARCLTNVNDPSDYERVSESLTGR